MDYIRRWIADNRTVVHETAAYIFNHPETAMEEQLSSAKMAEFMANQGFEVTFGIAGLETAFEAVWGSEGPILGFLAEYDALPDLGQEPVSHFCKIDGPGHGCGHHLLGMGAAAAAAALKYHLEQTGQKAVVKLFGCPAEEIMHGKIVMAKEHVFDDLAAAITWHPFDVNRVCNDVWQALDVKKYRFYGTKSHAANSPHLGRSALDAAELMNVGVNYLREHVTDDVRMHYTYLSAGDKPNIVPDFAETSYYIRGATRAHVDDASARIDDIARGAALMTGTRAESQYISGCREMKVNRVLTEVFYEVMKDVPVPEYTRAELEFAEAVSREAGLDNDGELFGGLKPLEDKPGYLPVATDVSDVSHIVPTVLLSAAVGCKGTPLHHWSLTAQGGSSIGYKAMDYVAECMAKGGAVLAEDTELLKQAWNNHKGQ